MSDLFQGITPKNKEKLLYTLEAHSVNYRKNSRILASLRTEDILAIITKGKVRITRTDANGNETIIEDLRENDVFGSAFSSFNNNEYDIITKEDTSLILIDYERIMEEENTSPYYHKFIKNLLAIISEKTKEKNERLEILTKKTIRDRLLEYFKIMANKLGSNVIYLPINYTDLAAYLATDRSAMTREMKNLVDEGFIKKDNKRITLLYR